MPGSSTRTVVEPDHYGASLRPAQLELVLSSPGDFKARLTSVELHHLRLSNASRATLAMVPSRLET
jgi:hypothetical protein